MLGQTSDAWELVILDNSDEPYWPDGTPWNDPRIRYHWELCDGVADASTKAMRLCRGDVILPMGDDDMLPARTIQHSADLFARNPRAMWMNGRTTIINEAGHVLAHRGGDQHSINTTRNGEYWLGGAVHWRAELTRHHEYRVEYDGAADFDLYLEFIRDSPPILTGEDMYVYVDWPGTDSRVRAQNQWEKTRLIRERNAS